MTHRAWLTLTLLSLFIAPTLNAQSEPASPDFPSNPYGIVEGFWFPELTCELYPGWERIIFDWAQHQPNGPTDWFTLNVDDRWLKSANGCDREVVALLKNTPTWATTGLPGAGVPSGLYLPVDHPDNHWANFVRQAAYYYAPRGVHRFIIWNEPDIAPDVYGFEFAGTLEDYTRMVEVASIAARQGNPAAKIHLAGMTYWHNVNEGERLYLDALLEALTQLPDTNDHGAYFDAISLHIYFRTDTVYDIIAEARALLDGYGLTEKAIWLNETNAPPTQDPEWPVERPVFQYTLEQQANFLVHAAALAPAAGAERVAVYKLYDQELPPGGESFGILVPSTQAPRPAFASWQQVTGSFRDIETAVLHRSEIVDAVHMTHRDGTHTITAWTRTDTEATITLSVDGEPHLLPATICNGDDPAVPCPVGGPPLILTSVVEPTIHEIGTDGTMVAIPPIS